MIQFFTEDISFDLSLLSVVPPWLISVASSKSFQVDNLNFILCSDEYLLRVNQDYLQHDYYTDVITFDNSEDKHFIAADIFISIDRVRENSSFLQTTFHNELLRVIVHGTLHLMGFNDKTKGDKSLMTTQENLALELYYKQFNKDI